MDKWMWRCCAPGSQISSPRDARASPAAIPPVSASYHPKQIAASIYNTMPKDVTTHTLTLHLMLWVTFHWVENLCLLNGCALYKAFTSHLMWWFGGCLASEVIETRCYDLPLNVHILMQRVGNLMGLLDWIKHIQSVFIWCMNDCGMYDYCFSFIFSSCCVQQTNVGHWASFWPYCFPSCFHYSSMLNNSLVFLLSARQLFSGMQGVFAVDRADAD